MARHFTKTEIEEIGQALATRGVKDTDFDELTSLDGDEIIALVKGNKNMKTSVTILLSALSDLGEYYEYAGKATPSGDPGLLGQKLFFLAYESGSATYPNYGGITVSGEIAALKYDPAHGWEKETLASVDPAPRVGSTNLITSGGVATSLNGKQNKLNAGTNIRLDDQPDGTTTISATGGSGGGGVNFDEVPTQGSYNAVYSNGIFNAIQNVKNTVLTKADDSDVMHLGGNKNETATGVKNFSSGIVAKTVTVNEGINVGGQGSFQSNVTVKGNLTVDQDISEGGTKLVDKYMGKDAAYTKAETDIFLARKQNKLEAGANITLTPNPTTGYTIISSTGGGGGGNYTVDVGMDTGAFKNNTISSSTWAGGYYGAIYRAFSNTPIDVNPGYCSFAEGVGNRISGNYCHAEGYYSSVESTGSCGHAEGGSDGPYFYSYGGHVRGEGAHAEGFVTYAQGHASHTEGNHSEAYGNFSHAEGYYTKTLNQNEHASGIANEPILNVDEHDVVTDASIFSIGIGTVTPVSGQEEPLVSRKNAFLVMDDGDTYIYGVGGYNGTNYGSPNVKSVQTVINSGGGGGTGGEYVDLVSDQLAINGQKVFDNLWANKTFNLKDTETYTHGLTSDINFIVDNDDKQNYGTCLVLNDDNDEAVRVRVGTPFKSDDAVNLAYLQTNYKKYRAGSNITFSQPDAGGVITISSTGGGGGTGDYVDLTTNQTVGGEKLFTDGLVGNSSVTINDLMNYSRVDPDTQEVITWTGGPIHLNPDSFNQDHPGLRVLDQDNAYANIKIADPIAQEDGVNLGYLNTALSSANFQPRLTAGSGIQITNNGTRISAVGFVDTTRNQDVGGQKNFTTGIVVPSTTDVRINDGSGTLANVLDKKQNKLEAGTNITFAINQETGNTIINATGGGSGGATDIYTEIYYTDLVALRDSGTLVPGMKYRIIDYVTKTDNRFRTGVSDNRRSTEQQFDLIVTALSETELSEEAKAVKHKFSADYELSWSGFILPLVDISTVYFADNIVLDGIYRFRFTQNVNFASEIWVTSNFMCFPVFVKDEDFEVTSEHSVRAHMTNSTDFTQHGTSTYDVTHDPVFNVRNAHYFDNCNLEAWRINYKLDNDVDKYTWANYAVPQYMYHDIGGTPERLEFQKQVTGADGTRFYLYGTQGQVADLVPLGSNIMYLAAMLKPTNISRSYPYSSSDGGILYGLDVNYNISDNQGVSVYTPEGVDVMTPTQYVGNGVIYRMIDEWGNDCPYDFKNIQYRRQAATTGTPGDSDNVFVYTFNIFDADSSETFAQSKMFDATVKQDFVKDAGTASGHTADSNIIHTYNNVIKPCSISGTLGDKFVLNEIIFYNRKRDGVFAGCYENEFKTNCSQSWFIDSCYNNTFGIGCRSINNAPAQLSGHTHELRDCMIGNNCSSISLAARAAGIRCGNNCESIMLTVLSDVRNVWVGDGCSYLLLRTSDALNSYINNIFIEPGIYGTSSSRLEITVSTWLEKVQKVGKNSSGNVKVYCEADLVP